MIARGAFGSAFGVTVEVEDEATMRELVRELVREAGGDPEEWETTVVFDRPAPVRILGMTIQRPAECARCSAAAFERLRAEIPELEA